MALKIRGNTQILEGSIENTQLKDADVSLAKLSGAGAVSLANGASISLLSGATIDVSAAGASLTLADDQISGDKIEGGTIGSVTISTADIDGGTIDGATIATSNITVGDQKTLDVSAGTLTLANDQISGNAIDGGTISEVAIENAGDLNLSASKVVISDELNVKTGSLMVDSAGNVSMSGKLTVNQNLEVLGTLTSINTTDLDIKDKLLTLAKESADSAAANDAGIHIDGANKSLKWSHGMGAFVMDAPLNASIKSDDGSVTLVDAAGKSVNFINKTTTDLAEGSNLYYTQARFDSAFEAKSTTELSEGSNLYYTQARFDSAFEAKSTTELSEGSNLYYTQARFDSAFDDKNTDALTEGNTNKYYLDSRARAAISVVDSAGDGSLVYNEATGQITYRGVTESQVRGYFSVVDSAGDGSLTYDAASGVFNYKGISDSQLLSKFSVVDSAGDGSLTYDAATGVFNYKGISDAQIYGKLSAGSGLSYDNSGEFSIPANGVSFDMLGCEYADVSMDSASDSTVPTSLAIKTYVDNSLSAQSSADFLAAEKLTYKMSSVDASGMINVKDVIECHPISSAEADVDNLLMDSPILADAKPFEPLSMVFLNGQKLRYGSDKDYFFADAAGDENAMIHTHIHFVGINLEHEDEVEIKKMKTATN